MDKHILKRQKYKCINNNIISNHVCRCWHKFNGYLPYYHNEFIGKQLNNKIYCLDCYYILKKDYSVPMVID
jgi:hypothetical protein